MVLTVFAGLPGVGKSTLAVRVGAALPATLLAVDTVDHVLHSYEVTENRPGYAAYGVVAALAGVQLALGQSAVIDAVNPIGAARDIWTGLADRAQVRLRVIEVVCSDETEHRRRVEHRRTHGTAGADAFDWIKVLEVKAVYEPYIGSRLVVDTGIPGDPLDAILAYIRGVL
jgi:predicted kinase